MIFDRYIFRHLLIAILLTALTLTSVIFLTQSLRFLELVIESGASGASFWILTLLALPRFFEVILPVALMIAVIFVYNRMTMDSELVVMRAAGTSPARLARPAIFMSVLVAAILFFMTAWAGPASLSGMQKMRTAIKTQYSALLFREGIFNAVGNGLTLYIRERGAGGELRGLMIHDHRDKSREPITILAQRGMLVTDRNRQQVMVFDGLRQDLNPKTGALNRLQFDRYTIDLPDDSGPARQRWREPDERTLTELLNPDHDDEADRYNLREFRVEIHRRIASPLLAPSFTLLTLALLLTGYNDRRGQGKRIVAAIACVVVIQSLYLAAFNLSRQSDWGLILMYGLVLSPIALGLYALTRMGERRRA